MKDPWYKKSLEEDLNYKRLQAMWKLYVSFVDI